MTGWLLDTNVLSELRRARPDGRVIDFVTSQPLDLLYVSVVTFAEIRFGIERVKEAARRLKLTEWLDHKLRPMFENRALEVSEDVMLRWRLLVEEGRKSGHVPPLLPAARHINQDHGCHLTLTVNLQHRTSSAPRGLT